MFLQRNNATFIFYYRNLAQYIKSNSPRTELGTGPEPASLRIQEPVVPNTLYHIFC